MTPTATVRLQLTSDFGFDAAIACVDYYAALGISHYYLSPVFEARRGSTHGYDIVDPRRIRADLGGMDGLRRLAQALHARGMGMILDIVPNHMGVAGGDNAWWNDVLAHGERSRYAKYFDIDWNVALPDLRGKVLLPFLDRPFTEAFAEGRIALAYDAQRGLVVTVGEAHYPLSAPAQADVIEALADPALRGIADALRSAQDADELDAALDKANSALAELHSRDEGRLALDRVLAAFNADDAKARERLDSILRAQHYRLEYWRAAPERINWRRFFDITDLAALRADEPSVFDDVHALVLDLFADGTIDGVRVDHVDGLADPIAYCNRLRDEFAARANGRAPAYVVVEKIFGTHEAKRDWGISGTTGYDFMDHVSAVLHNPAGQNAIDVLWRQAAGAPWDFPPAVAAARRQILDDYFPADLSRIARLLVRIAQSDPKAVHLTDASIRRALAELAVAFPVYRFYGRPGELAPEDTTFLAVAGERANRLLQPTDYEALDFVIATLRDAPPGERALADEACTRFQQLTVPIAAKAIEDTVFYREARLLSRNEVGSDPNVFSLNADEFHAACATRGRRFPTGLLATATHDHKRGEDTRMRIAVLSDDGEAWSTQAAQWHAANTSLRRDANGKLAPDPVDELMLYQTLVGMWPLAPTDGAMIDTVRERAWEWWRKALREAKRHTSWIAPSSAYE
ncbi:MAG TPA: malto-oligosyltrehalose synthase, partial [Rudaea sp.]